MSNSISSSPNTKPPIVPSVRTAGRWYIRQGWSVLPLWGMAGYLCQCGSTNCKSPGKHPIPRLVPNGLKQATQDLTTFSRWIDAFPDMNIGVVTGADSGIVVLDIDSGPETTGDNDGFVPFAALQQRYGNVDDTLAVQTGGGGLHLYFRHPGGTVRNSASTLGKGLDVRGDGGYVVAPPSMHINGTRYVWDADGHPRKRSAAAMPVWLATRTTVSLPAPPPTTRSSMSRGIVTEGGRNVYLASWAGTYRSKGHNEQDILDRLISRNQRDCTPPLPDEEVAQIAASYARYER